MKRTISIYTAHKNSIQFYLRSVMQNFQPISSETKDLRRLFEFERAAEIIYCVNADFVEYTPSIGKKHIYTEREGTDKSFYFKWVSFEKESINISNPYLHHITGLPTLTAVKHQNNEYLVVDFDLMRLLEELRLVEHNNTFDKLNVYVMASGGVLLGIVAIFLMLYGGYVFFHMLFFEEIRKTVIHKVFTSIISINIGFAIYDLAKNIIENDVLFRTFNYGQDLLEQKTLTKFLTSIIIALSIESLMVTFKIILSNYGHYGQLINVLYLVLSITLLIAATAVYNKFSRQG